MQKYFLGRFSLLVFLLLGFSTNAISATINFSGQLRVINEDTGTAVYSGTPAGTNFTGFIDDVTFNGQISDGTTVTSFNCCIAAGGLSISNNIVLDADSATVLNSVAGSALFSAGQEVEIVDIEGDTTTISGGRIEIGLSYILTSGAFDNEDPSSYPFNPNDVLLKLFFILEENAAGTADIYDVLGAINSPNFTSTPVTEVTLGDTYSYEANATDPDVGDTVTFSLDTAPAGMTINTATGQVNWTPAAAQLGDNNVTVRVTDQNGLFDTQSFIVTVSDDNEPPMITSTPGLVAILGDLYSYDVAATDPNTGDTLTFSLDTAPAGMTINTATGLVNWTPTAAQLGDNNVTVRVTDQNGLFDTQSFTVTASDDNEAPTITSTPGLVAILGDLYSYDVEASDPNAGDTLTFSLDTAPAGMTINTATGQVNWSPAAAQLGGNNVTVRVTDQDGLFDTQSFIINVTDDNVAPTITSTPLTAATIDDLYSYDVEATDANPGDTLTFSLDLAPAGMTIDTASGLIQWSPAGTQEGDNSVTVRVTDDGGLSDTQSFTITVTNDNVAPTITSTPVTEAAVDGLYSYDVEATDANPGDTLTFSLDLAPAGMTIDTASGLIQWSPAGTQEGDNSVTVRVTDDGGLSDTQSFTITVTNDNVAPTITSTPVTEAAVDGLYSYDVEATDANPGDTLTFSLDLAPAGFTIDTASGLIQWTPAGTQLGDNSVTVRVTDDGGLSDTQSFIVTVIDDNVAPTITSTPLTAAAVDGLYSYDVEATDANAGDTLTFSLDLAPAGMTIDTASGLIQWNPAGTQQGDNNVTVRVADDSLSDTQSFIITVTDDEPPLVITSTPVTSATVDELYSYDVETSALNIGDNVTFNLDVAPAGMTINTSTGLIQWKPISTQIGDNAVTVRATNTGGLFDTQSFTINVTDSTVTTTVIIDPIDDPVTLPVTISGSAESDSGITAVRVGIRDQTTKLWWNSGNWGEWILNPIAFEMDSATEASWQYDFDPGLTPGTGRYRVFVRAVDGNGNLSESTSTNFNMENNLQAIIESPGNKQTVVTPVQIQGAGMAPLGVQTVLVGIRDQNTLLWWNNGSWGEWVLNPVPFTVNNIPGVLDGAVVDWQTLFDHTGSGGSGEYRVFVRVRDIDNNLSNSNSRVFFTDPDVIAPE